MDERVREHAIVALDAQQAVRQRTVPGRIAEQMIQRRQREALSQHRGDANRMPFGCAQRGFSRMRRATETPFNLVFEARP